MVQKYFSNFPRAKIVYNDELYVYVSDVLFL